MTKIWNATPVRMAAFAAVLLATAANSPNAWQSEKLQVTETPESYVLAVAPVSQLTMTIPKAGWTPGHSSGGGALGSPRYFIFEDKSQHRVLTGWFESAADFTSARQIWFDETAAWKQKGLAPPQAVSFLQVGDWQAVRYDLPSDSGNSCHIRAHWVQAGTWIEIHLWADSEAPKQQVRSQLEAVLKGFRITARKG